MTRLFSRGLVSLAAAVLAALALTVSASATPDRAGSPAGLTSPSLLALIGNDDLFSVMDLTTLLDPAGTGHTQHYGPYTSGSPDSGTCGNEWAQDTFDRDFVVRPNGDGSYTIVEQFKNGSFVTNPGFSPAACDVTYTNHGAMIVAGKTGSMHGYFIVSNVGMQTSTSAFCDADLMTNANCTTAKFINSHFTMCYPATCTVTTFFDHYAAGDQGLLYHEWKNASPDRGGNGGDIASS
jgi:hypothetical protein